MRRNFWRVTLAELLSVPCVRRGTETKKGYVWGDFRNVWERYLPPFKPKQAEQLNESGSLGDLSNRNTDGDVALSESPETPINTESVAGVALRQGGLAPEDGEIVI